MRTLLMGVRVNSAYLKLLGEKMNVANFVEDTYKLFESFDKPKFATDINHCKECQEHNEEINSADRRNLTPEQIGTECWGISTFLTPQAMGYYMPRFIELAVTAKDAKDGDPYMCIFLNQIGLNSDSHQFSLFSDMQRLAVLNSLVILKSRYLQTLTERCWEDEIENAITQWGST